MTEFVHILSYISSSKIRDRDPLVYLHNFKGLNPAVKSCGLLILKQRTNNSKKLQVGAEVALNTQRERVSSEKKCKQNSLASC